MPRIAVDLPIFKALGATGGQSSPFDYPQILNPTVDGLGTKHLRRDSLGQEVLTTFGVSLVSALVPVDSVRYIIGLGYRSDSAGPTDLTIGVRPTGGDFFPLEIQRQGAAVFQWFTLRKLPFILPEQTQFQILSTVAVTIRLQIMFVDLGLGEYIETGI